jgi:hypothetical protein
VLVLMGVAIAAGSMMLRREKALHGLQHLLFTTRGSHNT